MFLQFMDDYYLISTIEINNPQICNLKSMTVYYMDSLGNALTVNNDFESFDINNQVFIDIKYLSKFPQPKPK